MVKPSMQTSELMSVLADGQLAGEDFVAALQACQQDESAPACWNTYHLIGDVLRSPASLVLGGELAFVSRISERLAQLAPNGVELRSPEFSSVLPTEGSAAEAIAHRRGPASNDGNFRWKLVAGFASLAAVSAIAWDASSFLTTVSAPQELAQISRPYQMVVDSPQGSTAGNARLDELLAAHKQLSGMSALQEPSGFLRNATFETSQNTGR